MQTFRLLLVIVLMLVCACSHSRRVVFSGSSPDSKSTIEILYYGRVVPPWQAVRLDVLRSETRTTIWRSEQNEILPCFAESAWTDNSLVVVIVFRDCWHTSTLMAYDLAAGKETDPNRYRALLSKQIRTRYHLGTDVADPLLWATDTDEARHMFARR
jgi:hypothetical protein